VPVPIRTFGDIIDDNSLTVLPDLVAYRSVDFQFTAGFQSEINLVQDRASDPFVIRNARDYREPHAGRPGDHLQDRGHGSNAGYAFNVVRRVLRHEDEPGAVWWCRPMAWSATASWEPNWLAIFGWQGVARNLLLTINLA
jgi:hypothetical protein